MRLIVDDEKIRNVFAKMKDEAGFEESKILFEKGKLPVEMLQALSLRPEILKAFGMMGKGVYPGGLIERNLKEKVILKASRLNDCQFCVNSHVDIMTQLGIPKSQIEELDSPKNLTDREKLALRFTESVMKNSLEITDSFFENLRSLFSQEEIVELTFLIGYINMLNYFNNTLQVTYQGDYDS